MELVSDRQSAIGQRSMIDNPELGERLLTRLQAALPISARVTSEAAAALQAENPTSKIPLVCSITWVSYAGDEGGIVCRLDFVQETEKDVFASITHLPIPAGHWRARSPRTKSTTSSACVASSYKTLPESSGRCWIGR